jgi:FkbM family methyltransferase
MNNDQGSNQADQEVNHMQRDLDFNQSVTVQKPCRHGNMLFLQRDQFVGRSLELYGEFSELEGELFAQLLRPGQVVVEVGANIGAHTVHLAKLVGAGGAVLAFEPQRVIFQILCANIALNALFNVHTYHAGLGREKGTLKVPPMDYDAVGNFGGLALTDAAVGEDVSILALDGFNLPSLQVLKIDVEGMEADVLLGARNTIARHRPVLYVENDRQEKSAALIRLIEELGYTMYWHTPNMYNQNNYFGNNENIFPGIVSINLLCIPKELSPSMQGFRKVSGPDDWWQNAP